MKTLIIEAHGDDSHLALGGMLSNVNPDINEVEILTIGGKRGNKLHGLIDVRKTARLIGNKVKSFEPDVVLTHYGHDLHQDHQAVYHATVIACRPTRCKIKTLACYEVPTVYQTIPMKPTIYYPLSKGNIRDKWNWLQKNFPEEIERNHEISFLNIEALARIRGMECGAKLAEALSLVYRIE